MGVVPVRSAGGASAPSRLADHAPPVNANPTSAPRLDSPLPLSGRTVKADEGGERPRAELPVKPSIPNDVWSEIASRMDRATLGAFHLTSKTSAAIATEHVKELVVKKPEDLIPALTAFKGAPITHLTAEGLGAAEARHLVRHLAENPSITSITLRNSRIGDEGARALATNPAITTLDLRGCNVGPQDAPDPAANTDWTAAFDSIGTVGVRAFEALGARFKDLLS